MDTSQSFQSEAYDSQNIGKISCYGSVDENFPAL